MIVAVEGRKAYNFSAVICCEKMCISREFFCEALNLGRVVTCLVVECLSTYGDSFSDACVSVRVLMSIFAGYPALSHAGFSAAELRDFVNVHELVIAALPEKLARMLYDHLLVAGVLRVQHPRKIVVVLLNLSD